jgi:hypothetical protein
MQRGHAPESIIETVYIKTGLGLGLGLGLGRKTRKEDKGWKRKRRGLTMFDFSDGVITKVFNPLKIAKGSMLEFQIGKLKDTGFYRFKKIIGFDVDGRNYARYLIYSKTENTDYIFEVFPGNDDQLEAYLYELADTVPFSEEFLEEVAGQRYLTTPDGNEYERCIMPEDEGRMDGIKGRVKVYDLESGAVEKDTGVQLWDYQRDAAGKTEYLNLEMIEDSGMFRIFKGELLEDIFYKLYQAGK